jgi:hypothetical protein
MWQNTAAAATIPLSQIPLGKVISVNGLKFIKINDNQYMAVEPFCKNFKEQTFAYTGGAQTFNVPCSGNYKIELWGAGGRSVGVTLGLVV